MWRQRVWACLSGMNCWGCGSEEVRGEAVRTGMRQKSAMQAGGVGRVDGEGRGGAMVGVWGVV